MQNLYNTNGLLFWTQEEINLRKRFETEIVDVVSSSLKRQNVGFNIVQVEAPQLMPTELINSNYTDDDVFNLDELTLRPETTMGSYIAARELLNPHSHPKYKLPLVVWQHGKSFRREQNQPTKFMRLKEFYQLEFQIIYDKSTANDYSIQLSQDIKECLERLIGECRFEESDRLPSYSAQTNDIVCVKNNMEVCSISKRLDFNKDIEPDFYKIKETVLEVAIGTDRLIHCYSLK